VRGDGLFRRLVIARSRINGNKANSNGFEVQVLEDLPAVPE